MLLFYNFPCLSLQSYIFSNIYTINFRISLLHAFVSHEKEQKSSFDKKVTRGTNVHNWPKCYLCFLSMSILHGLFLEIISETCTDTHQNFSPIFFEKKYIIFGNISLLRLGKNKYSYAKYDWISPKNYLTMTNHRKKV